MWTQLFFVVLKKPTLRNSVDGCVCNMHVTAVNAYSEIFVCPIRQLLKMQQQEIFKRAWSPKRANEGCAMFARCSPQKCMRVAFFVVFFFLLQHYKCSKQACWQPPRPSYANQTNGTNAVEPQLHHSPHLGHCFGRKAYARQLLQYARAWKLASFQRRSCNIFF